MEMYAELLAGIFWFRISGSFPVLKTTAIATLCREPVRL